MVGMLGEANLQVWGEDAAYVDGASPDAVADTTLSSLDIAVSESGSLAAATVDGLIEVAAVRGLAEPVVLPTRLEGAGAPAHPEILAFGGDRFLASGNGETAMLWDVSRLSRLGDTVPADLPYGCQGCGVTARTTVSADGSRALVSAVGEAPVLVDLTTTASRSLDPDRELGIDLAAFAGDQRGGPHRVRAGTWSLTTGRRSRSPTSSSTGCPCSSRRPRSRRGWSTAPA